MNHNKRNFDDRIKDHRKRGAWGWAIFQKTEGRCAYCGKVLDFEGMWHLEHVVPRTKGGDWKDNLLAACQSCNFSKGGNTVEEWRAKIPERLRKDLQRGIDRFGPLLAVLPPEERRYIEHCLSEIFDTIETTEPVFWLDRLEDCL